MLVGGDEGLELRCVSIVLYVGGKVEWMDIRIVRVGWHGNCEYGCDKARRWVGFQGAVF